VSGERAKLYSVNLSHPARAAGLMLERKGIPFELKDLQPGFHPLLLRLAGFRGWTVPALRIDGTRVQGSRRISRALDRLRPKPPLFPAEEAARRAVEEAEEWAERELQPVPRRIFRWALGRDRDLRRWFAEFSGMPVPGFAARVNGPLARAFARVEHGDDETVRQTVAELPAMLDRVDTLIAEGVIGGAEPNAADYQIATTVRVLLSFADLRPLVEARAAGELARRLVPDWPAELPPVIPPEWL